MDNAKILLKLFRDNGYFYNLSDYLKGSYEAGDLSYKDLKYLYKNLYMFRSLFIKQNIYPVAEFLKRGYSTKEAEQLADMLEDAKNLTIFCYSNKEVGNRYNKLFYDLSFVYNNYDKFIKQGYSKENALFNTKCELEITSPKQRQLEQIIYNDDEISEFDLKTYSQEILEEMSNLKKDILINNKDTFINTKKYNRLSKTKTKLNKYLKEKNIKMKSYER